MAVKEELLNVFLFLKKHFEKKANIPYSMDLSETNHNLFITDYLLKDSLIISIYIYFNLT